MTVTTEIQKDLLAEGLEDYVGLWAFVWCARERMGIEDPARRRSIAMGMVGQMLREGLMRPGDPEPDYSGFKLWELSTEESLSEIEREWDELGREPNIGEIAHFQITHRGKRRLASPTS